MARNGHVLVNQLSHNVIENHFMIGINTLTDIMVKTMR